MVACVPAGPAASPAPTKLHLPACLTSCALARTLPPGTAEEVVEESVADNDMIMIRGPRNTRAVTGARCCCCCCGGGFVGPNLDISQWTAHYAAADKFILKVAAAALLPTPTSRAPWPPGSQCCCAAPMTTCWTRWTARCTTPSASSSGCWRTSEWWQVRGPGWCWWVQGAAGP